MIIDHDQLIIVAPVFVPVFRRDVVEGELPVGDGDEALEDGRLKVGEDEARVAARAGVLAAVRHVAHCSRQRPGEDSVSAKCERANTQSVLYGTQANLLIPMPHIFHSNFDINCPIYLVP